MDRKPVIVAVARGHGLVARFGDVVLFLARESAATERILAAVEAAAATDDPGATVVQRLVTVIFGDPDPPASAFGVVAPTAGGTLVLLHGAVAADVGSPTGSRRLSGTRAMTWLDEIVRDPVRQIVIGPDGDDAVVHAIPHTDLRAGVVPGGGAVVHSPL